MCLEHRPAQWHGNRTTQIVQRYVSSHHCWFLYLTQHQFRLLYCQHIACFNSFLFSPHTLLPCWLASFLDFLDMLVPPNIGQRIVCGHRNLSKSVPSQNCQTECVLCTVRDVVLCSKWAFSFFVFRHFGVACTNPFTQTILRYTSASTPHLLTCFTVNSWSSPRKQ